MADKKEVVLGARAKRSWRCWRWLTALAALVLYAVDGHHVVIGLALDDGDGADCEWPQAGAAATAGGAGGEPAAAGPDPSR